MKPSAAASIRKGSSTLNRCAQALEDTMPTLSREAEKAAAELISELRRPKKVLPFKTRKQSKAIKKAAHREETGAIRESVFKRAQGKCELLCADNPASEMHHLEGGSGRRRQMQAVSNCVAACPWCHREYHRDPEAFRYRVTMWAKEYGYPVPSRFRRPVR